jgi:hypothetical protein
LEAHYYLRLEVPKDLREAIDKRWIKKSLGTKNHAEAKQLFAPLYANTLALFDSHRNPIELTPKDIEVLGSLHP